jgi:hypothetical protein
MADSPQLIRQASGCYTPRVFTKLFLQNCWLVLVAGDLHLQTLLFQHVQQIVSLSNIMH